MSETSDSPSRKGLAIFSLGRTRNRDPSKRSSAAYSLQSSGSGSENHTRNVSHDSTLSRADDGEAGGVKKLVGKTLGRRRRKKQELADLQLASEEADRGRSVADRGTLENESARGANTEGNTRGGVAPNGRESFDDDDGGSRSSLITMDDEPAAAKHQFERPPLPSAHPSHVGFLTSSSPLVQTTTIPITDFLPSQLDGAPTPPSTTVFLPRMNNLPNAESTTSLSNSLRAPIDGSQKRSPSPVGRLRDALKSKKGASPNTSPERRSRGEGGSTTSLNSFADSRRGSVSSRLGSLFPERSNTVPVLSPQVVVTPSRPQTAKLSTIDTSLTPSTPPQGEAAPLIVNTPPTPTDVGAPRFSSTSNRDRGSSDPLATSSNVVTSPSGNMISHRRVRSGSANLGPSKLSNIQSAPLTPTPEHPSPNPNQQTGFFANVFSAAQNAASNLSNSIATTTLAPGNKSKSVGQSEMKELDDPIVDTLTEKSSNADQTEEKELAVKTLGMGDLMLSHLGISENNSVSNTPTSMKFPEESRGRSESANNNDDPYSSRTVLGAPFTHHNNLETGSTTTFDNQTVIRPSSFYEPSAGERTPPNGSVFEGKSGIQRSGSIKSALGGRRRKRNSSATTGGAIGAAIAAANGSIANPNPEGNGPKITGFAVASKKRNRDFHQLFRSVPDDDYLIEDYSCALQREILAHGRLYVSEGHLCFSSNIFGWVTTLVMSFDEIVSVEKRNTALLFKNGLMISTLHAKNVFASFTSRDSTYNTIVDIWKLGHPSLRSSLNGVRLEETGGGDRTEKYDGKAEAEIASQSGGSESGSDASGDEVYDEDDDDDEDSGIEQGDGSVQSSLDAEKIVSRKPSAPVFANGSGPEKAKEETPASASGDYPGPATHAATECTDGDTHYAKIIADELIPAPLGKIYNLLFGAPSVAWMRNWLSVEQKCLEVTLDDLPLNLETKTRGYSYIKPLNGSIGPRQTKCVCTETLDFLDFEKSISVTISTQTPDVPSGNVFSTKTKYCLSWGEGNTTRLQMNCAIEWTGKSWLKGPIEKGANDGQVKHAKDLVASLKTAVSARRSTVVATGKGKKKGRKGRESKSVSKLTDGASDSKPSVEDWGLLEPLHSILGPVVDIFRPLATSNIMYGILVGLLVAAYFRFGIGGSNSQNMTMFGSSPDRVAAYEEIWRREESQLWDWLDDRVGMQRVRDVGSMRVEKVNVEGRLRGERMETREVEAAVRVTEEKLRVLKHSLEEKKGKAKEEREREKVKEGKEEL